jgi:formate hydrogenlyase subunit 3/multisubunit Na+/H+ antiporter MnhD subunit
LIARRAKIPVSARVALLVGTLGIMGVPPFAGFCGKSLLSAGAKSPVIQAVLILVSLGTVVSFAKLIPLFRIERGPSSTWSVKLAFVILGLPILLFLPFARLLVPAAQLNLSLHVLPFVKSLLVVGGGLLLYRFLPKQPLHLPQRIFRLEEGILVILSGFFLIYLLSVLG